MNIRIHEDLAVQLKTSTHRMSSDNAYQIKNLKIP